MQYSWLPQERRQLRIREKAPLVISLQCYGRLQANAYQTGKDEQRQKQLQREAYQEQLRLGGEELLRQFGNRKLCRTEEERCMSDQRRQQEQQQEAKQRALEQSEAERKEEQRVQRQRIEKAQQLLEQLRPGPRELNCAKLHSEVLRGINAQRQLLSQFAAEKEQQRILDRRIYSEQVLNGLDELHLRHSERRRQLSEHKRELLESIEDRRKEREAAKAEQTKMAEEERKRNEVQLKEQQEKEKVMQEKRRQQRREQAFASLAAAEQRRQQQLHLDAVELALCEVHNEAKSKLDKLKFDLSRQRVQRRIHRNEQLAKELAPRLHYSAGEDQRRHELQLADMRRAHSVEQQSRRQRLEQTKLERLAMQRSEQEQAAAARRSREAEQRKDVEKRKHNELIHVKFKQQQRQEQVQRQRELRAQLDEQESKRLAEEALPVTNYNLDAQLECLREDAFFVDYAHKLMTEAQAQGCPLKPLVRALEQYKKENRIGAEIRIPRHLITKLTMGRRTKGDSSTDAKQKKEQEDQKATKDQNPSEEEKYKKQIEENLQKINALMLAEAKKKDDKMKEIQ